MTEDTELAAGVYSTKPSGTAGRRGLGLALVSQVLQRHGGELTETTYGSVVSMRIPRKRM